MSVRRFSNEPWFGALSVWLLVVSLVAVLGTPTPAAAAASPRVGVLTSDDSVEFGALLNVQVENREAGWFDALQARGFAPEWIDAETVDATALAQFDVVVLPYTLALSHDPSVALVEWVRSGGGLVVDKSSPRVFRDPAGSAPGPFEYWFAEYGGSLLEWGPLSVAYQKDLVNDPTPWDGNPDTVDVSALSTGSHPIITRTLAATGLSSLQLDRAHGGGYEFTVPLGGNSNTTRLMTFDIHVSTSVEGVDPSVYDGYQAAEAIRYGYGRLVYWDFLLVDFTIHSDGLRSAGGGLTQRDVAEELMAQSVQWVSESDGSNASVQGVAAVTSEVSAYSTVIVLNSSVRNAGNASLVGTLYMRVLNPAGKVVFAQERELINLGPGDFHDYSVSYKPGKNLDDGEYTVEFWFTTDLPDYRFQAAARTFVVRSQGKNIPHSVVVPALPAEAGDMLVGYRPATGAIETLIGPSNFGGTAPTGADTFLSGSFGGTAGADLVVYDSGSSEVSYLGRALTNWVAFFEGNWTRGWTHVVPGDYNGDGTTDVLFYRASDGLQRFYTITTSGRFVPLTDAMDGTNGWTEIVPGDFNNDGRDDVLWYRASDGLMRYYEVQDSGRFVPLTPVQYGTRNWNRIPSGDFDGDGKDDVLWYRSYDGLARVYTIEDGRHIPLGPAFTLSDDAAQLVSGDFSTTTGVEVAMTAGSTLTVLDFSSGTMAASSSAPVVEHLLIAKVKK